ncbi:MAG: ABC transporter permease [Planctomycetota bacterium]|nr:MAG: ABC transporter permease [Planctomycetota bacterium]
MNTRLGQLWWVECRLQRRNLLLAGLLFTITSMVISTILHSVDAMSTIRLQALSGSSDLILRVRPPDPEGSMSFARPMLEEDDISMLASLPGLKSHAVISGLPIPASMRVRIPRIIDSRYDVTLYTLEASAVPAELQEYWHKGSLDGDVVPMILNPQLLTLYNLGFADRYRTPRLGQDALLNLRLPLSIGRDLFGSLPHTIENHDGKVIGFSHDLPVWGAGIPQAYADAWLPVLYPDRPPQGIGPVLVTLRFADLSAMVQAQEGIAARGLPIDGESGLAQAVLQDRAVARGATMVIMGVIAVILLCAMSGLTAAHVQQRRLTLALCRSIGARPWHLAIILGGGPLVASVLGAIAGIIGAWLITPALVARAATALEYTALSVPIMWSHLFWAPLLSMIVVAIGLILALTASLRRSVMSELRDH